MARTCEFGNCVQPVWGTDKNTRIGYCKYHQTKRTDKKPKKIPAHNQRTRVNDFSFGFDNQVELFQWCWENAQNEKGEVFCKYTGEKLNVFYNTEMFWSCFAHVLSKGKYPWFKLNSENIETVLPIFHTLVDQGTSLQRANHPTWRFDLWYNKVEEIKQKYIAFKKEHLLA